MDEVILPFVDHSPEAIARKAAEKAEAVDRKLARTQPKPNLPPVREEARVPVRVGSVELPFFSSLNDPARVTGTHTRAMRQFRPRVLECVACEYKKLETHLGDPAALGLDPEKLRPEHRHHFGLGERDYNLCKSCYDTFGTLHPKLFELFAEKRMREDQQRSLRRARNFPEVAERVAAVDSWRRDVLAAREFGQVLEANALGERRERKRDGLYDGGAPTGRTLSFSPEKRAEPQLVAFMPADDGVHKLSDFTDQSAPDSPRRLIPPRRDSASLENEAAGEAPGGGHRNGRSRVGDADPMWRENDAGYDPGRVGADHAEAIVADESWEARRTRLFRSRMEGIERALAKNGEAAEKIDKAAAAGDPDPSLEDRRQRLEAEKQRLEHRREALYRRWDPRLSPSKRNPERAEVTSPFAPVRKSLSPYPRTTLHSGVDEWFASEPAHVRAAHARHLAKVEEFLADAPRKLKQMGLSDEQIQELTSLPPLEPEPMRRYPLDDPPLRERIQAEREHRPHLPLAADLDQAIQDGAAERGQRETARWARETVGELAAQEARQVRTSADDFIDLAGRVHARDKLAAAVREADGAREHVSRWAHTIHRAEQDLKAATDAFAREIRVTFHDPRAFQAAFKQLSEEEKRAMLRVLRERPGDFAREFRSAGGHDFGNAGRLATGKRKLPSETTVGEMERSGILTAEAGVRYLDSVNSRETVRVQAAGALGVPGTTGFDGLRSACRAQMREATAKKSAAISERASLGKVPSRKQLGAAFTGLNAEDRTRVTEKIPGVSRLLEPRGRALARAGHSL